MPRRVPRKTRRSNPRNTPVTSGACRCRKRSTASSSVGSSTEQPVPTAGVTPSPHRSWGVERGANPSRGARGGAPLLGLVAAPPRYGDVLDDDSASGRAPRRNLLEETEEDVGR